MHHSTTQPTYPADFTELTGFEKVLQILCKYCNSEPAKHTILKTEFYTDIEQIRKIQKPIAEIILIIQKGIQLPSLEFIDNSEKILPLRTIAWIIEQEELFHLSGVLRVFESLLSFTKAQVQSQDSQFASIVFRTEYHSFILKDIQKLIDEKGNIRDNASEELYRLRQQEKSKIKEIDKRLNTILKEVKAKGLTTEDASLTIRNGRSVIPLPASGKYSVQGIIHDESATGQTVYVEPLEIVQMNNSLRENEQQQLREIRRLLSEISAKIHTVIDDVLNYYQILVDADIIFAKAKFAIHFRASFPSITDKPYINWFNARHPVLEDNLTKQKKQIVPLTVELDKDCRMLVLSGANAGGKSVVIKTVALIQYMLQCGLPVPVDDHSHAGIFRSIFLDIGDGQSFEHNLSTYTSHLEKLKMMLLRANNNSLYLIDEVGSGTDPELGGAVAVAALQQLHKTGAYGIITTHIDMLKRMADTLPAARNSAMLFDSVKLEPVYVFKSGIPGNSYTFEIARRTGISSEIIDSAKQLVSKDRIRFEQQVSDIEKKAAELDKRLEEARVAEDFFAELVEKYQKLLEQLDKEKESIIAITKQQAKELLTQTNQTIEKTIREIKESGAEKEKTKLQREELKQIQKKTEEFAPETILTPVLKKRRFSKKTPEEVSYQPNIGMTVRMKNTYKTGTVLEILKNNKLKIQFDTLQLVVDKDSVVPETKTPGHQSSKNIRLDFDIQQTVKTFRPNLDIRGMKADEVMFLLEKHLDEAILAGTREFSILHGKGWGILRQTVRDILKKHPFVENFESEHAERGGDGITIVTLKR